MEILQTVLRGAERLIAGLSPRVSGGPTAAELRARIARAQRNLPKSPAKAPTDTAQPYKRQRHTIGALMAQSFPCPPVMHPAEVQFRVKQAGAPSSFARPGKTYRADRRTAAKLLRRLARTQGGEAAFQEMTGIAP